ncbi:unnamed protein product [Alternaria alternata]
MDDISVIAQRFDNLLHESTDQAESPSTLQDAQPLQYDRIPRSRSIRVLDLAPGTWNEPVNCSLRTVHLDDDDPRYEAISYAWGDYNDRKPVICNGYAITTTRSLFEALQRFRYVDTTRTLWADALCINQADDDEKTSQVRLMSYIYTKAVRVLVWLQHEDDQVVKDSLDAICRFVSKEDCFSRLGGMDEEPQPTPNIFYRWLDVDVTSINEMGSSAITDAAIDALDLICDSPWFGRGWVVQEVALSTSTSVFWGHGQIGFEWLGVASYAVGLDYAFRSSTGSTEDRPSWVPDWNEDNGLPFVNYSDDVLQEKDILGLVQISETVFGETQCIEISGFRIDTINREIKEYATLSDVTGTPDMSKAFQALLRRLEHMYSQQCLAFTFGNPRRYLPLNSVRIANRLCEYRAFMGRGFAQDTRGPEVYDRDDFSTSSVPSADRFAHKHDLEKGDRCLFVTSTEMLGIGPQAMIPGDVVVVLHGGQMPFVLRPADNGLWRLVGECYLYDVNEGRVHREWEQRGSVSEKFTIC